MSDPVEVVLHPYSLSPDEVIAVARDGARVTIPEEVLQRAAAFRAEIDKLAAAKRPVYGVSTGFGALAQRHIAPESRAQLQKSLIRSHAAGMGERVDTEIVRAMMLLRARTMASGRTGVRPIVLQTYVDILNAGIVPYVHEYGSLGCSGDLAPLAACALVLMGEGHVVGEDGTAVPAAPVLAEAGIEPVELAEKEGLALTNGTDGMLGMLLMAVADLRQLLTVADVAAAMNVEAQLGTDAVFTEELCSSLRPHPGQTSSAATMTAVLADSPLVASHKDSDHLVQDAYSLRCSPQVTGAARDAVDYASSVAGRELISVIDNPVVLDDGSVSSNGNFHGAPLAHALDFLAIIAADVASISERRTDRLLDPARNQGLPAFLADDAGIDSGLMIAQYTQAGLVNDMKQLASPSSVDSIPSSAMQEDHVSMGWNAGIKLRKSVKNLTKVLAVEVYSAARGIELREHDCSPVLSRVITALRDTVPGPGQDRFLSPELEATEEFVQAGRINQILEESGVTAP